MSEEIASQLDTFETQVKEERYEDARETLETLEEAFDSTEAENSRTYTRSLAAAPSIDRDTVSAYSESMTTLGIQRSQFLLQAALYLSAPDAFDRSELLALVETLRSAEAANTERRRRATSALQSVTVPARPAIVEITGKRRLTVGERTDFSVRVENVGDEPTDSLTLSATAGAELTVGEETHSLGTLSPGADQTVVFAVTGATAGESSLAVELTSGETTAATDAATVAVTGGPETANGTPTQTATDSGTGDDELRVGMFGAGAAGLGALGGGAALYRYLSGESETDTDTEQS